MKFYSEKTGLVYDTADQCTEAETVFDKELAAKKAAEEEEKARKEKLATTRKERAAEVEEAYKAKAAAEDNYNQLLNAFLKDYGSFHMTLHKGDSSLWNLFDKLLF